MKYNFGRKRASAWNKKLISSSKDLWNDKFSIEASLKNYKMKSSNNKDIQIKKLS